MVIGRDHNEYFWNTINVLFLDLGAGFTRVFTLGWFIELYIHLKFVPFSYIQKREQIFINVLSMSVDMIILYNNHNGQWTFIFAYESVGQLGGYANLCINV